MKKEKCEICHKEFSSGSLRRGSMINETVYNLIKENNPSFDQNSFICLKDLNTYRTEYIRNIIQRDIGEVRDVENEVIKSFEEHELLSEDTNQSFDKSLSFADRMSDALAEFGGSWKFLISFSVVLGVWIIINSINLMNQPFDPYPYILLNLVLSCLASVQAPIIMMSQNRQEAKDRLRAEMDYKINLKSELEIRNLRSKLDLLASDQWNRLLEIQQFQTDMIEEITERTEKALRGK